MRLHRYPDDPRSETVMPMDLMELFSARASSGLPSVEVLDDSVRALALSGSLTRVELPGGAAAIERTGVRDFQVSPDERYLLWQDLAPTNADDPPVVGDRQRPPPVP